MGGEEPACMVKIQKKDLKCEHDTIHMLLNRLHCKSMQQTKEFKTTTTKSPKTVARSDKILMLEGRG